MKSVEFYTTPEGTIMMKALGEPVEVLTEGHREIVSGMIDRIANRYPEAFAALSKLYSASELNRYHYEYMMVARFIRCNFGEYDALTTDIDADGFFRFEEVRCPLRGECRHEGVICKAKLATVLSDREKEIVEHVCNGENVSEIAEKLHLSPNTVIRHRENIKAKTQTRNLPQLVDWYHKNVKES